MNIILSNINSSYSHFGLGISYIKTYLENAPKHYKPTCLDFTSEDTNEFIIESVVESQPELIGFSCYIWNITKVHELTRLIKQILPNVVIAVGGPEVSYTPTEIIKSNETIDYVISGDGEKSFYNLAVALDSKEKISTIAGLTWREESTIRSNKPEYIDLDQLPSPYKHCNIPYDKPVVHYETSRGCVFKCAFCTSSIDNQVREFSLTRVFDDLKTIGESGATYVNILDRSFAVNKERALKIMTYMRDNLPTVNFHFEINPHLLDESLFEFFKTLKNRRFQFEMGIQSTDKQTRKNINIAYSAEKTNSAIARLKEIGTIKLYLDLITGLPGETIEIFKTSFNTLMNFGPETCQIETLKLLPGTPIRQIAHERNYKFNKQAPYKILSSDAMDFQDIMTLEKIKGLVDKVYNKGWLKHTILNLHDNHFNSYWDLFMNLNSYWTANDLHKIKLSKKGTFEAVESFLKKNDFTDALPIFYFEAALNFKSGIEGLDKFRVEMPETCKSKQFWIDLLKEEFNELYYKKPHKYSSFYEFPFNPLSKNVEKTVVMVIHPLKDKQNQNTTFYILN